MRKKKADVSKARERERGVAWRPRRKRSEGHFESYHFVREGDTTSGVGFDDERPLGLDLGSLGKRCRRRQP